MTQSAWEKPIRIAYNVNKFIKTVMFCGQTYCIISPVLWPLAIQKSDTVTAAPSLINEHLLMDLSIDFNIKRAEPFTCLRAVMHLTASSTPVLWFPAKVPLSIKQPIYHSLPSISLFRGRADAQRSTWIKLYEPSGAGEEQISAVSVKELLFVSALVWPEKPPWVFTISTRGREIITSE